MTFAARTNMTNCISITRSGFVPGHLSKCLPILMAVTALHACNVPVFRYALERWIPDQFTIAVLFNSDLPAADREFIDIVSARCNGAPQGAPPEAGPGRAAQKVNATVLLIDGRSKLEGTSLEIWNRQKTKFLPRAIVLFPQASGSSQPLWAGPVRELPLDALTKSPAREKIAGKLLAGDAAVWVMVESGMRKKDAEAAIVLQKGIAESMKTLSLPELSPQDRDEYIEGGNRPPLKISFSVIKVGRNDPLERMFVGMLEMTEPHLRHLQSEPMAFAVFGRGRTLYCLVGAGINPENILETNAFLTGPCACTIKEQNPGKDLLMTDHWDSGITTRYANDNPLPELPGLGSFIQQIDESERESEQD